MKKIFTIILAVLLLNGVTELHQFLKLPLLLNHFRHHRVEDPAISLLEFLKIHYSTDQHPADNDDNEDNELPFKSMGTIQHTDIPLTVKKEINTTPPVFVNNRYTISHPEGIPCHRSYAVFHPPRNV
jgi:hypothetical protein